VLNGNNEFVQCIEQIYEIQNDLTLPSIGYKAIQQQLMFDK